MTNHVVLNNVDHHDLRIIRKRSPELGDNVMCAQLLPQEFRDAQNDYPIFFHKDPDNGKFLPYAMFGLQENENLFLEGESWNAGYLPFLVERGPFSIGIQQRSNDERGLVISIDLDHPRVSRTEGDPLFLPHGGNTDYIERISYILKAIKEGVVESEVFVKDMLKYDLLEPFTLEVELNSGAKHRLEGFYTINEEKLVNLDGAALADLSGKFFLPAAYMVVASLSNIRKLIEKKNQRL
jgi:hypothetical protein